MSKYDWTIIQEYYDQGHTFREITAKFGAANATITTAVRDGRLRSRDKNDKRHKASPFCLTCKSDLPPSRTKYCSNACHQSVLSPHYRNIKQWRRNLKEKLVHCFGGRCGQCGLIDDAVVFDFHHLDGSLKEFTLSQQIRAWAKVAQEAAKCVMLCAHCHRKHHAGIISLRDDLPRFADKAN